MQLTERNYKPSNQRFMQETKGSGERLCRNPPSIPFVSDASYSDWDKDKGKFIEVTIRYTLENADSKKNNYQAHVKTFDHRTLEDVLLWYTKLQEIIKKKPVSHQRLCSP